MRARSRGGAETKRKVATYAEAKDQTRQMRATGQYREIWIEEAGVVPRAWRDLEPKGRPAVDMDRVHFISVEEEEK